MTTTDAAVREFLLPDLGEGLTEATLVQWLVAVGDEIVTDQPVAEVETAKSIVELPSPHAGVITSLHGDAGSVIRVGAPVLAVRQGGHPVQGEPQQAPAPAAEPTGSGNVLIGYGTGSHSASARRRRARSRSSEAATAVASGAASARHAAASASPVAVTPVSPAAAPGVAVRSPIVRRLAKDLGVDVQTLAGTGSDGAVTRSDVLAAAAAQGIERFEAQVVGVEAALGLGVAARDTVPGGGAGFVGVDVPHGLAVVAREPFSQLRRAVAAKLTTSRTEIPEATVWVDADATELWNLRPKMAAPDGRAPSLTALLARFTLLALAEHPLLAARLGAAGDEIVTFDGVNLGVAADTARGLLVPHVPRADRLSLRELDERLRELAAQARDGRTPPALLSGSTFTLNNYGSLGVDGSAAIINHPEVAILGIGRMIERPWVLDGAIVARRIVQLSLVFDHRVCDGGYAASFLRHIVASIENPLSRYPEL